MCIRCFFVVVCGFGLFGFVVCCLLLVVCCWSLIVVCCVLCVACCLVFRCVLLVVWVSLFVLFCGFIVRCWLFAGYWLVRAVRGLSCLPDCLFMLFGDWFLVLVMCCLSFVVCCVLLDVCCLMFGACCAVLCLFLFGLRIVVSIVC